MSAVKVAVACGLAALLLSACGIAPKPQAGSAQLRTLAAAGRLHKLVGFHGILDDPRVPHAKCLRREKVRFHEYRTKKDDLPAIQVGTLPTGPTIIFYPTPGIAQGLQIMAREQGAEIIGNALLYPNGASGTELTKVEDCTAQGVFG